MAEQCERQAAQVKNERAREILLGTAASWRKLAEDIEREKSLPSRPSFPRSSQT
jgi:hypothetical protein